LKELGHTLDAAALEQFYHRFVELADRKKAIYDQDLVALATQVSAPAPAMAQA
jgi:2-isopropylmalate synthase